MRLSIPDKSLLLLLIITIVLIVWYQNGMDRTLIIDAGSPKYPVELIDDRGQGGGSVAKFSRTKEGFVLECDLSKKYDWPYCEISIKLAEDAKPLDISKYRFIRFRIESTGPGVQNVKSFVLNFGAEYSYSGNSNSRKINQIQFDPTKETYPLDIPLNSYAVPSWWVSQMGLSPLQAAPEMDRVTHLQIATGDYREEGKHKLVISAIEIHGKWLTYGQLTTGIIILWVIFGFGVLINNMISAQKAAQSERKTKEALQDINSALSIEKIELQEQANRDHLTGALNRMGLRSHLLHLVAKNQRDKGNFSLIFIDIDHFKSINDSYGHDFGDQILQQFSQKIEQCIRVQDFFGRWGGEEFVLLCPGTTLTEAKKIADDLRITILTHQWLQNITLSASFGVAEMEKAEDISSLIKRADVALYTAKAQGRNRVVAASTNAEIDSGVEVE